jgi:outer membrane protein W
VKTIALALCMLATAAHADDEHLDEPHDGALSYKRLYLRAGVLHIAPLSTSRELELSDVRGAASLALMDGPIAGSGAALDPMTIPAVIVGYVLPVWHDRLSLETVLAAPLHVTFRATGTLATMSIAPDALGIPTGVPALGSSLGEADAAPPLITAVYRIADVARLRPYVGGGIGVLVTYNARATNPLLTEVDQPKFHIDPAPGLVLQAGTDLVVWRNIAVRADVKYIAFMKAHATVENLEVRTPDLPLLETAQVGTATMDLWVNPLIVQIGAGIDF